jgi:hypothetical protein
MFHCKFSLLYDVSFCVSEWFCSFHLSAARMYYIDNLKKYISLVGLNEVIHIFVVIVAPL